MKTVFPCNWYFAIVSTQACQDLNSNVLKTEVITVIKAVFIQCVTIQWVIIIIRPGLDLIQFLDSCMIVSLHLFFLVNFYMNFLFFFWGGGVGWSRTVTECHRVASCS